MDHPNNLATPDNPTYLHRLGPLRMNVIPQCSAATRKLLSVTARRREIELCSNFSWTPLLKNYTDSDLNGNRSRGDVVFCGLEPLITKHLMSEGRDVQRTGAWPKPLPAPDMAQVASEWPLVGCVLKLVQEHDRGLIYYDSSVDRCWIIVQIALAYPNARIVIPTFANREAVAIYHKLGERIPDVGLRTSLRWLGDHSRVVVGTYPAITMDMSVRASDILIAPNAMGMVSSTGLRILRDAWWGRLFALLPDGYELMPLQLRQIRYVFGFHEARVPQTITANVIFLPVTDGPNLRGENDATEIKRRGIWHNRARNEQIVFAARKLGGMFVGCFCKMQSGIAEAADAAGGRKQVAIEVENLEHANALRHYLPNWPLVKLMPRNPPDPTGDLPQHLAPDVRENLGVVIVSPGVSGNDFFLGTTDVLIRADGGSEESRLLSEPSFAKTHEHLLLVDVEDHHHPLLLEAACRRRQHYRARGFSLSNEAPLDARLNDFIKTL